MEFIFGMIEKIFAGGDGESSMANSAYSLILILFGIIIAYKAFMWFIHLFIRPQKKKDLEQDNQISGVLSKITALNTEITALNTEIKNKEVNSDVRRDLLLEKVEGLQKQLEKLEKETEGNTLQIVRLTTLIETSGK